MEQMKEKETEQRLLHACRRRRRSSREDVADERVPRNGKCRHLSMRQGADAILQTETWHASEDGDRVSVIC